MKKTSIILVSLGIVFFASSCEKDFLELPTDGRLSMEEVFGEYNYVRGYVNNCYKSLNTFQSAFSINTSAYCDEAHSVTDVRNTLASEWYKGSSSEYYFYVPFDNNTAWTVLYEGIRSCNVFLAHIDDADLPEAVKQNEIPEWKGAVYTLRAFYYMNLIIRFGGVPIVEEPFDVDADFSIVNRPSFSDCARFIMANCDSALMISPELFSWKIGDSDRSRGKMTRAVAAAIKSRTALYAASQLWNDGTITWAHAEQVCKEALDSCLLNDYEIYNKRANSRAASSSYEAYFYTQSDIIRSVDKETIYEGRSQLNIWQNNGMPFEYEQRSAGVCPSQELVDAYETENGIPVLDLENPYLDEQHTQPNYNPDALADGYDPLNPYDNRDPRFKGSIYYNGTVKHWGMNDLIVETFIGDSANAEMSDVNERKTRTAYYLRKYNYHNSNFASNQDGFFIIFRMGELYLNYAEAAVENDNIAGAEWAVNLIRDRKGVELPPVTGLDKDMMRLRVRNERRVEMAFEGQRFFDVRRWMILDKTDKYLTKMEITKDETTDAFIYTRKALNKRETYDDKYLKFPIPALEVAKMENISGVDWQNEGW